MKKKLNINISTAYGTIILILCLLPLKGNCQSGDAVVDKLVDMGFENVSWYEDDTERVYVFENTPYRLSGVGVGKAIDQIQEYGIPKKKSCRVIVLENNIPMISLYYNPAVGEPVPVSRNDWEVTYDLGDSWKMARKQQAKNSSLFKVDVVIYPELFFRNYKLSVMYEAVINLSPSIEVSLWKGMKFAYQVIFPLYNDYGIRYKQIRPGFVTLTQTVRLPYQTFLTASVGTFNNFRWGIDVRGKHFFKDERFSVEARLGYTGRGYYEDFAFNHGKVYTFTGSLSANFYWPRYNTEFSLKGERYLMEEYGVRGEMIRHFRHASIGFYAMKVEHGGNKGFNGGFVFNIAIPPYKMKRKGYIPRVYAGDFGLRYNAGNEEIYGRTYRSRANDSELRNNSYNPYFIKSELLNY